MRPCAPSDSTATSEATPMITPSVEIAVRMGLPSMRRTRRRGGDERNLHAAELGEDWSGCALDCCVCPKLTARLVLTSRAVLVAVRGVVRLRRCHAGLLLGNLESFSAPARSSAFLERFHRWKLSCARPLGSPRCPLVSSDDDHLIPLGGRRAPSLETPIGGHSHAA